jgi:hypothetical protein
MHEEVIDRTYSTSKSSEKFIHVIRNTWKEETVCETSRRQKDNIKMNVIHLAQDMVQWRIFMNTITKLLVQYDAENFSGRNLEHEVSKRTWLRMYKTWVWRTWLNILKCDRIKINSSVLDTSPAIIAVRTVRTGEPAKHLQDFAHYSHILIWLIGNRARVCLVASYTLSCNY